MCGLAAFGVLLLVAVDAASAAQPTIASAVCGRVEYGIKAQRERSGFPGLNAPRLFIDPKGGGNLNRTYLRSPQRNDVFDSPFAVPATEQLHPVAKQIGVVCQGDEPAVLVRVLHWGDIESGSRPNDYPFIDYDSDDVATPDAVLDTNSGDGEWLDGGFALFAAGRHPRNPKKQVLNVTETFDFEVIVDPALDIRLPEVEGFDDGDPIRPTGRAQFGDEDAVEYVLDELMVLVPDDATLTEIQARWGAELVDRSPLDREGVSTALLRFDPAVLAGVDTSQVEEDLLLLEPDHRGTLALSSPRLLQLFALAASETLTYGTQVAPNQLLQSESITTGSTKEGLLQVGNDTTPLDAFQFNFLRDDEASMRTSVGRAWQVMEATVGFGNPSTVMIVDGGFIANDDFPNQVTLRQTNWGTPSPLKNSSGGESPWHGTASATTAAALVDNEFGTAGPAGPVADLVLVGLFKDDYKTLRRTRDMVDEYRPDVVNMSFSNYHYAFRKATEAIKDVYYNQMSDYGALLFASAGNKGINVDASISGDETPTILPCESKYVVCVGGMSGDGSHNSGANYGTNQGNRTVEINGPMCTYAKVDDEDFFNPNMTAVCGTSEASPFVAGVAALVKSANPSLSNTELRELLFATANVGAPFVAPLPGGHARGVNALNAVVAALDIELKAPTLTVNAPTPGTQISKFDSLNVKATARDTFNRPIAIEWSSNLDGVLGKTNSGIYGAFALSPGTHQITARAADFRGVATEKSVQVQVGALPQVTILSPQPTTKIYVGNAVSFNAISYDPDTYGPVQDNNIIWNVYRNGVDIWAGLGHSVNAPAIVFTPGVYDVYVTASDGEGDGFDVGTFTISAVPPGQHAPTATIQVPNKNVTLDSVEGETSVIHFAGTAGDAEDGAINGNRYRWTAVSNLGTKKVLCEGSNVPQDGNGGIVIPLDCSSFDVQMGPDQGQVITTWVVTLEAFDSGGLVGTAQRTVKFEWVTL